MRKMKTKLKIDKAYFYAPYVPLYLVGEKEFHQLCKRMFKDERRQDIFEEVEE